MFRHFTVNIRPHGKGRPRFRNAGKFVQAYTPKETRLYEQELRKAYLLEARANEWELLDEEIELCCNFYFEPPKSTSKKKVVEMLLGRIGYTKKPDIDNCVKAVMDSLNGVAWTDDKLVTRLVSNKEYSDTERVEVFIRKRGNK